MFSKSYQIRIAVELRHYNGKTVVSKRLETHSFCRPHDVAENNQFVGGVVQLDSAIANYRERIKGKKWWLPHFIDTI